VLVNEGATLAISGKWVNQHLSIEAKVIIDLIDYFARKIELYNLLSGSKVRPVNGYIGFLISLDE